MSKDCVLVFYDYRVTFGILSNNDTRGSGFSSGTATRWWFGLVFNVTQKGSNGSVKNLCDIKTN